MIIIRGANFYCYEAATDSTEAVLKILRWHHHTTDIYHILTILVADTFVRLQWQGGRCCEQPRTSVANLHCSSVSTWSLIWYRRQGKVDCGIQVRCDMCFQRELKSMNLSSHGLLALHFSHCFGRVARHEGGAGKSRQKREDRIPWNMCSNHTTTILEIPGTCFRSGNFLCPSTTTATGWTGGGKRYRSTFHLASMPAYVNKPICEPGSMGLGSLRVTCDRVIAKRGVGQPLQHTNKIWICTGYLAEVVTGRERDPLEVGETHGSCPRSRPYSGNPWNPFWNMPDWHHPEVWWCPWSRRNFLKPPVVRSSGANWRFSAQIWWTWTCMDMYGLFFAGRCEEKFKFSTIAYPDGLNDLHDPNHLNLRKALQKGGFDTRVLKVGTWKRWSAAMWRMGCSLGARGASTWGLQSA